MAASRIWLSLALPVLAMVACSSNNRNGIGSGAGGAESSGSLVGSGSTGDCESQCRSQHAAGANDYDQTIEACACGACGDSCTTTCVTASADATCTTCLDTAFTTGQCAITPCAGDADCIALTTCLATCSAGATTTTGPGATTGPATTSGPGATTGPATSSSSGNTGNAAQDCVDIINNYRASIGRPPYQRWQSNESCVDGQAQADEMSMTPHSAFGQCSEWAQDECPGWPGTPDSMIADCLAAMWAEGPGGGHYDNMANDQYTMAACGFYTAPDGSIWATQDFM